jgi:hypothetical protein
MFSLLQMSGGRTQSTYASEHWRDRSGRAQNQVLALESTLFSLGRFFKLPKGKAEVVRPLILDWTHNCEAAIAKE